MEFVLALLYKAAGQTLVSLSHNWPFLLASVLIAAALKTFMKPDAVSAFLNRYKGAGVLAATVAAVTTPFCSCGTTAVVLGMMASTIPMAPIVAFMVASPLSSPVELVYSAGLFGWPFAISFFATSIILGLAGGGIASLLEKRGMLKGQARFSTRRTTRLAEEPSCACPSTARANAVAAPAFAASAGSLTFRTLPSSPARLNAPVLGTPALAACCGHLGAPTPASCGCDPARPAANPDASPSPTRLRAFFVAAGDVSRTLLPMFLGFAFLGYLLNGLIPASLVSTLFGSGRAYGVPLAATIGLPLYISSEASLPLVRALLDSGMSQGAVMAFLIAGSGTSIGAITGALTIARWKVVGLVVAVLWLGAIAAGYGFDVLVAAGIV